MFLRRYPLFWIGLVIFLSLGPILIANSTMAANGDVSLIDVVDNSDDPEMEYKMFHDLRWQIDQTNDQQKYLELRNELIERYRTMWLKLNDWMHRQNITSPQQIQSISGGGGGGDHHAPVDLSLMYRYSILYKKVCRLGGSTLCPEGEVIQIEPETAEKIVSNPERSIQTMSTVPSESSSNLSNQQIINTDTTNLSVAIPAAQIALGSHSLTTDNMSHITVLALTVLLIAVFWYAMFYFIDYILFCWRRKRANRQSVAVLRGQRSVNHQSTTNNHIFRLSSRLMDV